MKIVSVILLFTFGILTIQSCHKDDLLADRNNITMQTKLSGFGIFRGHMSDLIPANGFSLYEIATQLFSDYAEKQRLIKIPDGSKINALSDGLPDFPDGTILVKTFFYYNDKKDTVKGKKIIETRILLKSGLQWNAGTYLWNNAQTEATLLTTGINETVNWVNEGGEKKVFSVHIPGNRECATCHNSGGDIIPIGPKIRNLNINVSRNNGMINQLTYFQNRGILNPMNPSSYLSLPDWQNVSFSVEQRARAYLDINCAHCHNPNGDAGSTHIYFGYDMPFSDTKIGRVKQTIPDLMESGEMPRLGTTTIDDKAVALIKEYINSL